MPSNHNPFPRPSALDQRYLTELSEVAKRCYERGWCAGTAGNFSLRGQSGIVWLSPSGVRKGDLTANLFIALGLEDAKPISPESGKASAEAPLHVGIYRANPNAKSVVHVHPPAVTKLSFNAKNLVFEGKEMQKALGLPGHEEKLDIPVIANTQDMDALGKNAVKILNAKAPVVILAGHGVYGFGKSPQEALNFIEGLEFLCATI
jgi:methylthioribulose-1-phosphate dehydratase